MAEAPDEFDPFAEEKDPIPRVPSEIVRDTYTIPPPTPPPPPKDEVVFSDNAGQWAAPDADPNEEPPEPEGHALVRAVADCLVGQEYFHGALPPDIAAIWGHPPHRASDEATARILVAAWGLDGFRGSALHRAALAEKARVANTAEVTSRFKAERERKKAKGR